MIKVSINTRGLDQLSRRLKQASEEANGVISRALNRAGDAATTVIGRQLAEDSGMGVRDVRSHMKTMHSTPSSLQYTITVEGGATTLAGFAPRQTRAGVSARPWGHRRTFPGSFMVRSTPFIREGAERLPIRPLFGPNLALEVERGQSLQIATKRANEVFSWRIVHELQREFQRKIKGGGKGADG